MLAGLVAKYVEKYISPKIVSYTYRVSERPSGDFRILNWEIVVRDEILENVTKQQMRDVVNRLFQTILDKFDLNPEEKEESVFLVSKSKTLEDEFKISFAVWFKQNKGEDL